MYTLTSGVIKQNSCLIKHEGRTPTPFRRSPVNILPRQGTSESLRRSGGDKRVRLKVLTRSKRGTGDWGDVTLWSTRELGTTLYIGRRNNGNQEKGPDRRYRHLSPSTARVCRKDRDCTPNRYGEGPPPVESHDDEGV